MVRGFGGFGGNGRGDKFTDLVIMIYKDRGVDEEVTHKLLEGRKVRGVAQRGISRISRKAKNGFA